jgi:hypothetical protein
MKPIQQEDKINFSVKNNFQPVTETVSTCWSIDLTLEQVTGNDCTDALLARSVTQSYIDKSNHNYSVLMSYVNKARTNYQNAIHQSLSNTF